MGSSQTRAIVSLVLGILSVLGLCLFTGIPALILGKLELNAIRLGRSSPSNRSLARSGFVLGIIGTSLGVLSLTFLLLWIFLISPDRFAGFDANQRPPSRFLQGEGLLEFKLVDDRLTEDKLQELIETARAKNSIPEGYDRQAISNINQALQKQIPAEEEIDYQLYFDPIDPQKIAEAIPLLLNKTAVLSGDNLRSARVEFHGGAPYVSLEFDRQGSLIFKDITSRNIGNRLAILVDGVVFTAPVIKAIVPNGNAQLNFGSGDYQSQLYEAQDLVKIFQRRYHLQPEKKSWLDRLFR
jgi:hypothetical protein